MKLLATLPIGDEGCHFANLDAFDAGFIPGIAALRATRPTHTWFIDEIVSPIKPQSVNRTLKSIYTRFVNDVCVLGSAIQRVVALSDAVTNAAPVQTAMVRRVEAGIFFGAERLILHHMVVTWA
jgi:hypothetical protein